MLDFDIKISGGTQKNVLRDIEIAKACLTKARKVSEKLFPRVKPKFRLVLCYSQKDYNKEVGRKTRRWESGVSNKRRILTSAPSSYLKLTDNAMTFEQIILHEVNHVFYMNFVGTFTPQWLEEGIASLIAGSDKLYHWHENRTSNTYTFHWLKLTVSIYTMPTSANFT